MNQETSAWGKPGTTGIQWTHLYIIPKAARYERGPWPCLGGPTVLGTSALFRSFLGILLDVLLLSLRGIDTSQGNVSSFGGGKGPKLKDEVTNHEYNEHFICNERSHQLLLFAEVLFA